MIYKCYHITLISFRSSICLYFYKLNKDFDTYHSYCFQANSSLNDEESLRWIVRVVRPRENAYVLYHKFFISLFSQNAYFRRGILNCFRFRSHCSGSNHVQDFSVCLLTIYLRKKTARKVSLINHTISSESNMLQFKSSQRNGLLLTHRRPFLILKDKED